MAKSKESGHRFQSTDQADHYAVVGPSGSAPIGYVVKVPDGWRAQDHNRESLPGDVVHRTRELAAEAIDFNRNELGLE